MATTEQLMTQYGVAWFGFDEASGNVIDKLGNNYVGTVTGATRVDGWNGEGKAMSFNGVNQYVQFNSKVFPVGEKSIRFKIKTTSDSARIISTSNGGTQGFIIGVSTGGRIGVFISNGTGKSYYANKIIKDDKWHDVFISWDGTTNVLGLKIYIDDFEKPDIAFTTHIASENSHYYNAVLGKDASNSSLYLNGQIDDLQVYNKALSPSDFTQKRLVIKTTDNKSLVLSPTSTRVKEIPNSDESTLLNHGGIIKEIDSATDRPLIDLTRTSTEYEIVNTTSSTLGTGKLFTVPINREFKTIEIENNI